MKNSKNNSWIVGIVTALSGLIIIGCGPTGNDEQMSDDVEDTNDEQTSDEVEDTAEAETPPRNLATPFNVSDVLKSTISPFGLIRHSRDSGLGHPGMDIPLPVDAPFYAVANGILVKVEEGSGGRGGVDIMLLLDLDGEAGSGWYFEYEHVTLESGIAERSELAKGQLFARNPGTAANIHLELGYWDGTFTHNQTCWVDLLESSEFNDEFINVIRESSEFIEIWTNVQDEGFYPVRGLLDTDLYPDGARLCYPLGTDVRIAVE